MSFLKTANCYQRLIFVLCLLQNAVAQEDNFFTNQIFNGSFLKPIEQEGQFDLNPFQRQTESVAGEVENLGIQDLSPTSVQLKWLAPKSGSQVDYYVVEYQYVSGVECGNSSTRRWRNITRTSATIGNLSSYSKYVFTVYARNDKNPGKQMNVVHETLASTVVAPEEVPVEISVEPRTRQATVDLSAVDCLIIRGPRWLKIKKCCTNAWCDTNAIYQHHMLKAIGNTSVVMEELTPFSDYTLEFAICRHPNVSSECSDTTIRTMKTSPSAPNAVQDLVVYSKGTNSISFRWMPPFPPNGVLADYIIDYENTFNPEPSSPSSNIFNITKCKLWPEYHCATLVGLQDNQQYDVEVYAANHRPIALGVPSRVTVNTTIEPSEAPYDLTVNWTADSDLELEWKHPYVTNGKVRHFNITASFFNTSRTVQEKLKVAEDLQSYRYTINNTLIPASTTVTVEVSAINGHQGKVAQKKVISPPHIPLLERSPLIECSNDSVTVTIPQLAHQLNHHSYEVEALRTSDNYQLHKWSNFTKKDSLVVERQTIGNDSILIRVIVNFNDQMRVKTYRLECSSSNLYLILLVLLLLIPIAVIALIAFIMRKKRKSKEMDISGPPQAQIKNPKTRRIYENFDTNPNRPSKIIPVAKFEQYVRVSKLNGELERQHALVVNSAAKVIYNELEDQFLDYVDMKYFDGSTVNKAYIIAEAPDVDGIIDFWTTIWHENVKHIILLTSENTSLQINYWPEENEEESYGQVNVKFAYVRTFPGYKHRMLILTYKGQLRQISQTEFSYCGLNAQKFVPLIEKLQKFILYGNEPILVHTRLVKQKEISGNEMERMGLVLLCDMCLRMVEHDGIIDVLMNLHRLCEHKVELVGNVEMYKLAHEITSAYLIGTHDKSLPNHYVNF